MKSRFLPGLIILVSLSLLVVVVLVLAGFLSAARLPWGGLLAGVLAVLHSFQLQTAVPAVRKTLLGAGLVTMALMALVLLLTP